MVLGNVVLGVPKVPYPYIQGVLLKQLYDWLNFSQLCGLVSLPPKTLFKDNIFVLNASWHPQVPYQDGNSRLSQVLKGDSIDEIW